MIVRFASWAPVAGLTLLVFSQRKSASRSYVWPSAAITGSRINSRVMEHTALSMLRVGWRRASLGGVCVNCVKRVIPRLTEVVTTRNKMTNPPYTI